MTRFDMDSSDVQRKLRDLQSRAHALHGQHEIPLGEICTPAFMAAHTDCASVDELLHQGGLAINSREDLEQMPAHELDRVVVAHSRFESWAELYQAAGLEWVRRQLGF